MHVHLQRETWIRVAKVLRRSGIAPEFDADIVFFEPAVTRTLRTPTCCPRLVGHLTTDGRLTDGSPVRCFEVRSSAMAERLLTAALVSS